MQTNAKVKWQKKMQGIENFTFKKVKEYLYPKKQDYCYPQDYLLLPKWSQELLTMTATRLKPRTTQFVNEQSTIWPNCSNG